MKTYITKKSMIKYVGNCPQNLIIPHNDTEAFNHFKKYNFVYNKQFIANSQHLNNGNSNNLPKLFPVIVRPITNLYGMGLGAYYAYNINQIKEMKNTDFWCQILEGNHISVDVLLSQGKINGVIAFYGKPDKLFTFDHWTYIPKYKLPNHIDKWIMKYLQNHTGVINLEIIGGYIIECHLRMGDLNYFQDKRLTDLVIKCYMNQVVKLPSLPQIFLIPIFAPKGNYKELKNEDFIYCANKTNTSQYILNYLLDPNPKYISNPSGGDRICIFTITNINEGYRLRKYIYGFLYSNQHWFRITSSII